MQYHPPISPVYNEQALHPSLYDVQFSRSRATAPPITKANFIYYFDYDILSSNGPQKHQLRAYQGWIDNNYRGLFEHATGTYKTATGLLCADHHLGLNDYVVISSPLQIIADNFF